MIILKWIEVNIKCAPETQDEYLTKTVRKILNECRSKYESWHFLWEGKPWPNTLRLRFFGNDNKIDDIKQYLEEELKDICHCYGEHGDCGEGKEYKGEANGWGTNVWDKGIKFMEFGSEFALELIENKDKLGKSREYKGDAFFYADRYTHLFLNQVGSIINEVYFDLGQGIFRLGYGVLLNKDPSLTEEQRNSIINPVMESMLAEIDRKTKDKIDVAYRNFKIQKKHDD